MLTGGSLREVCVLESIRREGREPRGAVPDKPSVYGETCGHCGQDNSKQGDVCTSDDCPGVKALLAGR